MNVANNLARGVPKLTRHRIGAGTWTRHAACLGQDPDLFFRDEHDHTTYSEARHICLTCPVRIECLNWAIDTKTEHGIFGGLTPRERKRLR